jgi:hypothetical protein
MKTKLLILNGLWLATAAGAYVLGHHRAGSGNQHDSASSNPRSPIIGKAMDIDLDDSSTLPVLESPSGAARPTAGLDITGNSFIDGLLASTQPVSEEHMERGIQEAFQEKDPLKSNLMFAKLLGVLTPENAENALQTLRELPRSFSLYNQISLFQFAWGQQDGPSSAEYAMNLEGRSREYSIASVMAGWATEQPQAAIAWVESLEDAGDRSQFTRGIVHGLAKTDPALATRLAVEASTNGDTRAGEYISTIAREQFRSGIEPASRWVESIPQENGLREGALLQVAESYVSQDPALAATWVQEYAGTGYGARAIGEVADEWAEDDPAAAINWVNSLPSGDERARAYREAVWEWTGSDPFAAAEHLAQMPAGGDRDAAITSLSRRHVESDPESAIVWADSIGNNELRLSTLTSTGQAWMRRDPAGPSTRLQSSDLPPEVPKEIANPPRNTNRYRR